MLNCDGKVVQVRCAICSLIKGREKLLEPKIDNLWKHARKRKATSGKGEEKVKAGKYYFLSNNAHVRNERAYFARHGISSDTVIQMVSRDAVLKRGQKLVQFRAIFSLLRHGRPLTDFKNQWKLFDLLLVPNCSKNHWSTIADWEMRESIGHVLAEHTKGVIKKARYFSLSGDEGSS